MLPSSNCMIAAVRMIWLPTVCIVHPDRIHDRWQSRSARPVEQMMSAIDEEVRHGLDEIGHVACHEVLALDHAIDRARSNGNSASRHDIASVGSRRTVIPSDDRCSYLFM